MWQTKTWNLNQTEAMQAWIKKHESDMQMQTILINNGYGISYRPLRKIY
jgi:hypothetical protein